ncbi:MAG: BolA family protein [Alphaproteobacteria bacterium]|jgi:BolA protein
MNIEYDIQDRLTRAFCPTELTVINESHRHAGHSGDDGSGESHFAIRIRATMLAGLPRLARHRAVQAALGDVNQRAHAIALDIG